MPKQSPNAASRAPLTRERIADAALALIEQHGLEDFSTRRLGQALGCEAMSIYHHFPSKAHVLDALVDRVLATLVLPPRHLPPAERILAIAQSWRALAHRHPNFYPWLALHRWNSRTGVHLLDQLLACFIDAGFDDERAARSLRVLGYYMIGATLEETRGYGKGSSSLAPLDDAVIAQEFAAVARASQFFKADAFNVTFALGLDALLKSLGLNSTASQL